MSRPQSKAQSRGHKLGYYRASQACDYCRKRKIRCRLSTPDANVCIQCSKTGRRCIIATVDRVPKLVQQQQPGQDDGGNDCGPLVSEPDIWSWTSWSTPALHLPGVDDNDNHEMQPPQPPPQADTTSPTADRTWQHSLLPISSDPTRTASAASAAHHQSNHLPDHRSLKPSWATSARPHTATMPSSSSTIPEGYSNDAPAPLSHHISYPAATPTYSDFANMHVNELVFGDGYESNYLRDDFSYYWGATMSTSDYQQLLTNSSMGQPDAAWFTNLSSSRTTTAGPPGTPGKRIAPQDASWLL